MSFFNGFLKEGALAALPDITEEHWLRLAALAALHVVVIAALWRWGPRAERKRDTEGLFLDPKAEAIMSGRSTAVRAPAEAGAALRRRA
jgi:hypothetical protein